MKHIAHVLFVLTWIAGWVLAKGFWSTVFAIFFPPWGWYLAVERAMQLGGVL